MAFARIFELLVSTHSRPKAAAIAFRSLYDRDGVSTHSRPKAAANQILTKKYKV